VRIGIVSDVHGNAAALQRAMDLIGQVDEWICLGDSIREFRFSNEVVAMLREHRFITIQGNHEQMFFSESGRRSRAAAWIEPQLMQWLQAQPTRRVLQREGKEILLVHATPWPEDSRYLCVGDPDFRRFAETSADILLYGHTHEPVVSQVGRCLVVNPGSTGEARLREDRLEMNCAVLDVAAYSATIIPFAL
jgi:putative phosphoesterase